MIFLWLGSMLVQIHLFHEIWNNGYFKAYNDFFLDLLLRSPNWDLAIEQKEWLSQYIFLRKFFMNSPRKVGFYDLHLFEVLIEVNNPEIPPFHTE